MSKSESRIDFYRWVKPAMALILFLVAFLPRAIYPVSRPQQWYVRSVQFIHDLTHGAWGEMIYSEHPGVTTMWLSGTALWLAGVAPEQGPEGPFVDPASLTVRESAIGVFPLALTIAGLVVLMYFLLVRIFDRPAAFSAALFVALDPFFIANSKVLHVDGLLSAFMSTSALALLVYLKERRYRWVILSGVLGGLALLTKSPAMFLLPYTALCLGTGVLANRRISFRRGALAGLVWLAVVCLVYFALYPAMWVDPLGTPRAVYGWAALNIELPHLNSLYFLGQPITRDPGPAYYLYTWAYKITPVVAVFALVALLYAVIGRVRPRCERMTVGLLFAFSLFFTLQMMLGAKKMPRYLLPAFPLVDVLAGVGLARWAKPKPKAQSPRPKAQGPKSQSQSPKSNPKSQASNVLIGAALLLQAALVLPRHPYYDTYFNELAGGARAGIWAISTQWQGEGVDVAARMLSEWPDAERQIAGSHKTALFRQYFVGRTVRVGEPADWYVFGLNNVMRGEDAGEGGAWDFYRRRQPWDIVAFDGIPYAWVYRAARGPQHGITFAFEPGVQLVGYDLAPSPHHPGETLRLQLYWQALEPLAEDYTVFVHVLSEGGAGQLVTQQDNPPVRGTRPTSTWEPGVVVVDPYDLPIPSDTPLGEYVVAVGLYRWPDLSRLPVRDGEGAPMPDDRVLLTTVHVEQEPPSAMVWIARALASLLVLSAVLGLGKKRG
jgi:4-amino-4-deoxy-L-arabinose transferase-like glycosyltransferase